MQISEVKCLRLSNLSSFIWNDQTAWNRYRCIFFNVLY